MTMTCCKAGGNRGIEEEGDGTRVVESTDGQQGKLEKKEMYSYRTHTFLVVPLALFASG